MIDSPMNRYRVSAVVTLCVLMTAGVVARRPAAATTPSAPPIYVILFTHIEDNTPVDAVNTGRSRDQYLIVRAAMLRMGQLASRYGLKWALEPDWKFLEAALAYEDASTMSSTGGKNILRYLRDDLAMAINPHSHEENGHNYSDVAYLLEQLGITGNTVLSGHVWNVPAWSAYRVPVAGQAYPAFSWRGDVLGGAASSNHTNDPIVSGVWRPTSVANYFADSPTANMISVGSFRRDVAGVSELADLMARGQIPSSCMMTVAIHLLPADVLSPTGMAAIENDILAPLAALGSRIVSSDFAAVSSTWRGQFGSLACTYIVSAGTPFAPAFTTQPVSQTIPVDQSASFSIVASGSPSPTYQWEVSSNGGSSFSNMTESAPYSGTTGVTLTIAGATAAMTGFRYRVLATNGVGTPATSTAATLTVTRSATVFTDDPLQAGLTPMKAVHITELRAYVNTLRSRYGLAAVSWTDPTLGAGTTPVKAVHVTELQASLIAAYVAGGLTPPTFTGTITAGSSTINAAQIVEIRNAIVKVY